MKQDIKKFKHLMAMLTKTGLQGRRHAIAYDFSKGRTESSRELTDGEMLDIIHALEAGFKELDREDLMRKRIISMAHELDWRLPDGKIDMKRLDNWCVAYGSFKKKLNAHKYMELIKLVSQFDKMYLKFIKNL